MLIRIGCNADQELDPGSASTSIRIRIQMRIKGDKKLPENKLKIHAKPNRNIRFVL